MPEKLYQTDGMATTKTRFLTNVVLVIKIYLYTFASGTHFTAIYDYEGVKMPTMAVVAIDKEGKRNILVFCVGERENLAACDDLFVFPKEHGVEQIDLLCSDVNKAILNALETKFRTAKRQRFIKHKMENLLGYIPEKYDDHISPIDISYTCKFTLDK